MAAPTWRHGSPVAFVSSSKAGEFPTKTDARPAKVPKNMQMPVFFRWIVLGVLVLPIAELAVFVVVAMQIGIAASLALTFAASCAGLVLLKIAGRTSLTRVRVAMADGRVGEAEIRGGGFFTGLAGILLVVPGFLTDVVALLLLLPPVQRGLSAALGRALRPQSQAPDGVVDLDPGEWNRVEERGGARDLPPG
jgi:UPF0716 protein FxsA